MDTKKKVSRRDFIRLAGLTAGATVLAACAPQVVTQIVEQTSVVTQVVNQTSVVKQTSIVQQLITPTPAPVSFTFMCDTDAKITAAAQAAVTAYEADHTYLTINLTPATAPTSITPWLAGGTAPDAFRMAIDSGSTYGLKNLLYDFAPMATSMGIVDQYIQSVWNGYKWKDGQVWCLPTDANTYCLWCNPTVFSNAGVAAAPTTWSEFEDACKAITKPNADKTKSIYAFSIPTTISWATMFMDWWLWREGGDYYDGTKLTFQDAMVQVFTKLRGLITAGYLPAEDNWQTDYWYSGQLAMEEYGQWVIPADVPGPWNNNTPTGAWTGSYARPTFTAAQLFSLEDSIPGYSLLAGFGYYCPLTNKAFDETFKFLWYTISDPTQGQMWVTPYNQLPVVTAMTHPWLETDIYKAFLKQLNTTKPFPVYPEITDLINNYWSGPELAALAGTMTPQAAVAQMIQIGNPVIAEYQALR